MDLGKSEFPFRWTKGFGKVKMSISSKEKGMRESQHVHFLEKLEDRPPFSSEIWTSGPLKHSFVGPNTHFHKQQHRTDDCWQPDSVRNLQPCCPCLKGRPHSFTVKTLQRQPMTPYRIGATWDKNPYRNDCAWPFCDEMVSWTEHGFLAWRSFCCRCVLCTTRTRFPSQK